MCDLGYGLNSAGACEGILFYDCNIQPMHNVILIFVLMCSPMCFLLFDFSVALNYMTFGLKASEDFKFARCLRNRRFQISMGRVSAYSRSLPFVKGVEFDRCEIRVKTRLHWDAKVKESPFQHVP